MTPKSETTADVEIVTYLEMTSPAELVWPKHPAKNYEFELMDPPDPVLHRELHTAVGSAWHWTDRSSWTLADWHTRSHDERVATWLARVDAEPIGFMELEFAPDGSVEVVYFGLMPDWIGAGYGGTVLAEGIHKAWQAPGTRRVWLHTCNFDHPNALANYKARGFQITHIE